jgi:RHS repeat-associated protein
MTWEGRELTSYTKNGITYTYNYDYNGYRLSKTRGTSKTEYLYSGDKLIEERTATYTILYMYGQSGVVGLEIYSTSGSTVYNKLCYYVRNLQGDIVKIISSSGEVMAEYSYNAWGECTIITNISNVATTNPFRYRGYYYDAGANLYYLNSRYYDPEVGRFISPDVIAEGGNLYAYCVNDPINRTDPSGNLSTKWKNILTIVAVAAIVVAVVALTVSTCGAGTAVLAGGIELTFGIGVLTAGTALNVATIATVVGLAATVAVSVAEAKKTNSENNHTVYTLIDDSGTVQYVGRTNDPTTREKAHKRNPARTNLKYKTVASGLSKSEARGLEQILMLEYHTKNTLNSMNNQINGISPKSSGLRVLMLAGMGAAKYLENQVSEICLDWTGQ